VILAAGLLVLLGLGLFVAGILTGTTALYWGCVAACVLAAVLLFLARRQMTAASRTAGGPTKDGAASTSLAEGEAPAEPARTPAAARSAAGATAVSSVPTQEPAATGEHAAPEELVAPGEEDEPGVEEVEVTDLLLVVDLKDEVLVVDEHPRYHVTGCSWLRGRTTIPLPLDEARTDGFTPCAVCTPDRTLAEQVRAKRAAGG